MSIEYLDNLRILLERVDPYITNLDVLDIVIQKSNGEDAFFDLVDKDLIHLAGVKWFLENDITEPRFIFKLAEYCVEDDLQEIMDFIHGEWINIHYIAAYKKVKNIILQRMPNVFDKWQHETYTTIFIEYNGHKKILLFGENSKDIIWRRAVVRKYNIDDITVNIVDRYITVKRNDDIIVRAFIDDDIDICEGDLKIYECQHVSLEELLEYV